MTNYEMPIVVRLSKEAFAQALNRPVDDPDVQMLGGLNIVLQPIGDLSTLTANPLLAQTTGAGDALNLLVGTLQPVEATLFQRLRSNPELATRFVLNPMATLEELGLLDTPGKDQVQAYSQAFSSLFSAKS